MIAGVVHRDPSTGTFWFDDRPVREAGDIPQSRAWAGSIWYAASGIRSTHWASLMRPGDTAFGPSAGEILGVTFRTGPGGRNRIRVLDARCWGVDARDPNVCFREIQGIRAQAESCGITPKTTASGTAIGVWMDRFDGKEDNVSLRQLPPRWRGLAVAALHAGPAVVLRSGAPSAVQIDVRKAYLAALRQPMPLLGIRHEMKCGGYITYDDRRWSKVRRYEGFVEATVRVSRDPRDPNGLPSLPIKDKLQGTFYATGLLRGVWTIRTVREAEERGEVEVISVEQFAAALAMEPVFAPFADFVETLPQPLQKRVYTRFWGKLGSSGGFVGIKGEENDRFDGMTPLGGLWWSWDGVEPWSSKVPPTYRPDIASFVLDANQRNVLSAVRGLAPGSVVATHVDAIWTTDLPGVTRIAPARRDDDVPAGEWRVKREGPLRFFGVGMYTHGPAVACSGYDTRVRGPLTTESMLRFLHGDEGSFGRNMLVAREWDRDPMTDPEATSRPCEVDFTHHRPVLGPETHSDDWTFGGWFRSTDEMVARHAFLGELATESFPYPRRAVA